MPRKMVVHGPARSKRQKFMKSREVWVLLEPHLLKTSRLLSPRYGPPNSSLLTCIHDYLSFSVAVMTIALPLNKILKQACFAINHCHVDSTRS
jgi:hypothetical protein